ncbi:MAG: thiosulfohydrolase SoxB [Gammaproteobacteria bacterium]|nr:thiosulfohydrolase SoxB [Gammaproteobacteria bacterium]
MALSRREFLQMMIAASAVGIWTPKNSAAANGMIRAPGVINAGLPGDVYDIPKFGNVSLLHFTDCHAQLAPTYYREPDIHIGIGKLMKNELPHLVGKHLLERFNIPKRSNHAYALSFLDFPELAARYGKTGGFAHLATLVKRLRAERPGALLLDGGDTWQGSATALWTNAQDMVDAALLLGVDVMTGHWEFTYGVERLNEILNNDFKDKIDFVAQNVVDLEFEDAVFNDAVIREINNTQVAIIGQAFPYTPIANPRHFVENWQFGIQEERLQRCVDKVRGNGAKVVVLLSHNGMDIDLKLANRVRGIDAIMGGHTHDAVPTAIEVSNATGTTLVINSGTSGKFLSVLDLDVRNGHIKGYKYHLVPVFSNLLKPDAQMAAHIEKVRSPYEKQLNEVLAVNEDILYRRGTFTGTFDQIIVDALMQTQDTQLAFSPGFRWGTTILPGSPITVEDLMSQTAITYPAVRRTEMTGAQIKEALEDIADNRFNPDPYMQQGGDMVRIGGLNYTIDPNMPKGKRITDMELNGKAINAGKRYVVSAWAGMDKDQNGKPIWDVVSEYLRNRKVVKSVNLNTPRLKNIADNKGVADHFQANARA